MSIGQKIWNYAANNLDAEFCYEMLPWGLKILPSAKVKPKKELETRIGSIPLKSPVCLAAGIDKNATYPHWHRFGFSCVEYGTVTFRPNPGNMDRGLRKDKFKTMHNNLGLPNIGLNKVLENIIAMKHKIPFGISIASLQSKHEDYKDEILLMYRRILKCLANLDQEYYVCINLSCPNIASCTSSLDVNGLIANLLDIRDSYSQCKRPLVFKFACDINKDKLQNICDLIHTKLCVGNVLINVGNTKNGLSGGKLRRYSVWRFHAVKNDHERYWTANCSPDSLKISIACGGIMSPHNIWDYNSITGILYPMQLCTGFLFKGTSLVDDIHKLLNSKYRAKEISDIA